MAKRKSKLEKEVKKLHVGTIIFVIVFLVLGVGAGVGVTYFLTKDDVFKLNGESEITLNVGDTYTEEKATAIAFGKDVSASVKIKGTVDTSKEGRYVVEYTIDNFRFNGYTLYRLVIVEPIGE